MFKASMTIGRRPSRGGARRAPARDAGRRPDRRRAPAKSASGGRPWWRGAGVVALAGGAGAGLMFFLDPAQGKRRRHVTRDRALAAARRAGRRLERVRRRAAADVYGLAQRATHPQPADTPLPNDPTLAQKVESILFRDPDVPKGRLNINVVDGVVVLRGEVERPDQITALEREVRQIPGVRGVESYLHLPHTPAPNKLDALEAR